MKHILILMLAINVFAIEQQTLSFTIKTANTDTVFQKIIKAAEEKGGYFTNYNNRSLSIRLPAKEIVEFEKILPEVEDKSFEKTDKSAEIERLDLQINSRKELLGKYFDLVKNASFSELQSVAREMTNLNAEIERLQGRKQAIEKRASMVSITIYATSPQLPPRIITKSPFEWINKTNLNSLKGDF